MRLSSSRPPFCVILVWEADVNRSLSPFACFGHSHRHRISLIGAIMSKVHYGTNTKNERLDRPNTVIYSSDLPNLFILAHVTCNKIICRFREAILFC